MGKGNSAGVGAGRYVAELRDAAGITQALLANRVTLSAATLSRFESGEKDITDEELDSILKAIGTPAAEEFRQYLAQQWLQVTRPAFDHPDRAVLWQANVALGRLDQLRNDAEISAVFLRHVELYDREIRRIVEFLLRRDHQVAFIGEIGVGKTTAICKLVNLIKELERELKRQVVLESGQGRTTICEGHVVEGPKYGLRITPRSESEIRKDVEDFAYYLIQATRAEAADLEDEETEDGDAAGVPTEVARAIRNMSKLTTVKRKDASGRTIRMNLAKELAKQYATPQELAIQILTKMDLLHRNRRDAWYPDDEPVSALQWLQQLYADVNNGRHPEFTLPQKIEIIVPFSVLDSLTLPLRVIDTKGIDQTAQRQDLECHFDDPRTLVVLCSSFKQAPEATLQDLLKRAKHAGLKDVLLKTLLLVLPQGSEAADVKLDDGTYVDDAAEGCDVKREQVHLALAPSGSGDLQVEFFNAKDDDPQPIRSALIQKISSQRQTYADDLCQLSVAVERLIENRKNEAARVIFEHVASDLGTWIDANRSLPQLADRVEEPLIQAIDATRYASTVRAAVRRYGDWHNLDYYHHLARGVRFKAVEHIGRRASEFRVILTNLLQNPELRSAREFLERVRSRLDVVLDEAYKRIETAGRETFKQTLQQDVQFWLECERRWGQGHGYRDAIRDMTDQRFRSHHQEANRIVGTLIDQEWNAIIALLDGMLRETAVAAPTAA
jgi:transcriptional regulator with XRE-family HTH domain